MLLYQDPICYEDEIQHLIGIMFLPLKISNGSQVKPELCVTYLWISTAMDILPYSTLDSVMTKIYK